jgi:enediyne biosynthesis protein E8
VAGHSEHRELVADLTRRGLLQRGGVLGLAALVAYAGPVARALVSPQAAAAEPSLTDAILQAFADTMVPGRRAAKTDLGNEIHSRAIAGVDPLPGAVEADALALFHHPRIGFDSLEPAFLAELSAKSLTAGGDFLSLGFDQRVRVCIAGLAFDNPTRVLWEAAAAVPFTAFCAAAMIRNATADRASGYRVMGLPGTAPRGYRSFSYRRRLSRERTKHGYLA